MYSKCKICRSAKDKLFLRGERCFSPKCAMIRKPYAPGKSNKKKGGRKLSDYGEHLLEKQKVRNHYGLSEKQFKRYFKSVGRGGLIGNLLLQKLETRFDNVIFRLGFTESRREARQLTSHGHFTINGIKVDIPSYNLKAGDTISIRKKSLENIPLFQDLKNKLKNYETPTWLSLDKVKLVGKVISKPNIQELRSPFNMQLVVEYYSR